MPDLEIEETDQQARLMGVRMERMTRDQPRGSRWIDVAVAVGEEGVRLR